MITFEDQVEQIYLSHDRSSAWHHHARNPSEVSFLDQRWDTIQQWYHDYELNAAATDVPPLPDYLKICRQWTEFCYALFYFIKKNLNLALTSPSPLVRSLGEYVKNETSI